MIEWARPGELVALREDFSGFWYPAMPGCLYPECGRVYTIRAVRAGEFYDGTEDIALLFEEIRNPLVSDPYDAGMEGAFHYKEFRPVRRPSIEVFQRLVAPSPARARELVEDGVGRS